jgi:hypothetical protein
MGFVSGSVSFRRFIIQGKHPKELDQKILDKLEEFTLQTGEYGVPDEVEYGWSGGRHIFDQKITFERNVFAEAVHFALRLDTNRVPSAVKKAYQMLEEETIAASNPSGHISKKQKQDVKDSLKARLEDDLKSGKFRRTKLLPILWDFPGRTLYCPATGTSAEKLLDLFERTFDLELEAVSAGMLALRHCEAAGKRRDYEDARPTRFVASAEGENEHPGYPWVAKGPQPKDFFGNEFLLWLWHWLDTHGGAVKTEGGEVSLAIDKSLDMDCAYGQTGQDSLRASGPTRMPEARDALRTGKVPRKMGLLLEYAGQGFSLGLSGESLAVAGAKFPEVEKEAKAGDDDERALFEERIAMLRNLSQAIDGTYAVFLGQRIGAAWDRHAHEIRKWIAQLAGKHATA